jgi:hypothetical protein
MLKRIKTVHLYLRGVIFLKKLREADKYFPLQLNSLIHQVELKLTQKYWQTTSKYPSSFK